jgi:hypothetical protein
LKETLKEELSKGEERLGKLGYGDLSYYRKTSIFHFYVEPHTKDVAIVFNSTKETFKMSQILDKLLYDADSVRDFIRNTLIYMKKIHIRQKKRMV